MIILKLVRFAFRLRCPQVAQTHLESGAIGLLIHGASSPFHFSPNGLHRVVFYTRLFIPQNECFYRLLCIAISVVVISKVEHILRALSIRRLITILSVRIPVHTWQGMKGALSMNAE